jgi:hypothetical protein
MEELLQLSLAADLSGQDEKVITYVQFETSAIDGNNSQCSGNIW